MHDGGVDGSPDRVPRSAVGIFECQLTGDVPTGPLGSFRLDVTTLPGIDSV
jgi:hypothetical protein